MATERNTRQRKAIRDVLEVAARPLSPKEILDGAQSHVRGMGIATVYRTLKLLADEGLIDTVDIPHHFYCRACAGVFEVEGCPGDFSKLAPPGFSLEGHELVLFGTCAGCHGSRQ
jgi:Fur family ferric uptake transcriptional regulator